jgi:hypothetical protein
MDLLSQANKELDGLKSGAGLTASAIKTEQRYIQSRVDPVGRLHEASLALAGPKPDPDFQRDLIDLVFLLDQRLNVIDSEHTKDLQTISPMIDWVITFQMRTEPARQHALQQWAQTPTLPWLIAAISKAEPLDSQTPALIRAAAEVPETSPAWQTVTYHRARLLSSRDPVKARALLDKTLDNVRASGPPSSINAFTALRIKTATTFDDFLTYAPRHDLLPSGQYAFGVQDCKSCDQTLAPLQFDDDAAGFFNRQAPLSLWIEAAKSSALPANMRRALLLSGWTRAVVLQDTASARSFAQLLSAEHAPPIALPDQVGFQAWLTILRNPGLRFYLDAGIPRSQLLAVLNSYGDSWWDANWANTGGAPSTLDTATFLSAKNIAEAKEQVHALILAESATKWLGRHVIDEAKSNAANQGVPEALHLVVRASRYGPHDSEISAEAFRILHRNYPNNPWTKKTPYHF